MNAPLIGNSAPDRNHIGRKSMFIMLWKPEVDSDRQAKINPRAVNSKEVINITVTMNIK